MKLRTLSFHALHAVAYIALRVRPPLAAKQIVDALGQRLPPLTGDGEARSAMRGLEPLGTCLSRSLAVAARFPGARIAIGVAPTTRDAIHAHAPRDLLHAHAWIELGGVPLHPDELRGPHGSWEVIARL